MKRCLFVSASVAIILVTLWAGLSAAQTLEALNNQTIQLADPNFEKAVRELINKPTGDIMSYDVAGITELDVEDREIVDMTGIEYFFALEKLNCSSNPDLRLLDVSHNTCLKWLNCFGSCLETLDLSKNVQLEYLSCGLSLLETLDVSHNKRLQSLECSYTQLAQLDISQNTQLEELDCSMNSLVQIDVSHNSMLKSLACGMNQLTSLDVSNNAMLELLECSENRLTALDLGGISTLNEIDCSDNELSTLDVSQIPMLKLLSCENNFFLDRSAILGLDENKLEAFSFDPQGLQPSHP